MFTKLERSTPVVQINGSVQGYVWTPDSNMKHLKKAEGYIDRNVVSIKVTMKSMVQIF